MKNPEKLATYGTQEEEKQNKNNTEKLATYGTQDEDKQDKNTTQYVQTNTNNINKTWALLQTTGGKGEVNIVFMLLSLEILI